MASAGSLYYTELHTLHNMSVNIASQTVEHTVLAAVLCPVLRTAASVHLQGQCTRQRAMTLAGSSSATEYQTLTVPNGKKNIGKKFLVVEI